MHQIWGYKKQKKKHFWQEFTALSNFWKCVLKMELKQNIYFFFFICKNLSGSDLCLTLVSKQDFFVLVYEHEASVTFFFSIHKRVRLWSLFFFSILFFQVGILAALCPVIPTLFPCKGLLVMKTKSCRGRSGAAFERGSNCLPKAAVLMVFRKSLRSARHIDLRTQRGALTVDH